MTRKEAIDNALKVLIGLVVVGLWKGGCEAYAWVVKVNEAVEYLDTLAIDVLQVDLQ